jgi:hypothetical protein
MDFESLSVEDVVDLITKAGFADEAEYFKDSEIDGHCLPLLTEDLLKEMGISLIGPRLLILNYIQKITGQSCDSPKRSPPKQRNNSGMERPMTSGGSGRNVESSGNDENVPKWKKDHEKMVENMRAARRLAKWEKDKAEGKDVGPPPEMPEFEEPPDLVACPNCGRKMGEEALRHHIGSCRGRK